ncbi:MAG: AAA family ATPase, partial [Gammaproteobacteria bacterium]|nr:AAA family ATPase [Gammaproteobacteria bacterium]
DKDKVEVDLIIEQGRKLWAVEVKRAASVQDKDGAGLARLAAQAGKSFQCGILLYSGANCLPLKAKDCFAVPMSRLWK